MEIFITAIGMILVASTIGAVIGLCVEMALMFIADKFVNK